MKPDNKPQIVFLYTELAGYMLHCFEALAKAGCDVHVFHLPVNPEAPFQFDLRASNCHFYPRADFPGRALDTEIEKIKPQLILCSGWIDKGYLRVCKNQRDKALTVLGFDNQMPDNPKSWLSLLFAKWWYKPFFRVVWVPGAPQVKYARALGFKENEIFTGVYTTNVSKIQEAGRQNPIPKRFVFVGRYVDIKGVRELWKAFDEISMPGWELWCAGQGELFEQRLQKPGIHHLGFVQREQMDTFVAAGGVFVLPSHKEPWGMVVHEFAAAGYPLICSESVGAASAFVREGKNGYLVKPGSVESLKMAMQKMAAQDEESLSEMGEVSAKLAQNITVDKWVKTVFDLLKL